MKKILITFCLLGASICTFAYYNYWDKRIYSGGPYASEIISSTPEVSNYYAVISKQLVTTSKLDVSVSMNLSWYNLTRKLALSTYWASWSVKGFKYDRHVYYAPSGSESYTELFDLLVDDKYIDVESTSEQASLDIKLSTYSTQLNEYRFSEDISMDISSLTPNKDMKLKIVYKFKPVADIEHDIYQYNPDETNKYIKEQTIEVTQFPSGSLLTFKIFKPDDTSVINVDGKFNPYYNTGSGDRYLIYNDPNAIISVIADTVNLPCAIEKTTGTKTYTYKGYGAFLASIGANSTPEYRQPSTEPNTGCGVIYSQCSRNCNSITNPYIQFLNDNEAHKTFLQKRGYDISASCFRRSTNMLTRSLDSEMSQFDENTVEDFSMLKRTDFRMKRIYHLRDLNYVNVYTKEKMVAGSIVKFMHSAIYSNAINIEKQPNYKLLLALGYQFYGPSFDEEIGGGKGTKSNILEFEIVPKVYVPRFSSVEKAVKYLCVTDSLTREEDFIHLEGKVINSGTYSPSIYKPVYLWELSTDGVKWEEISTSNHSNYIINRNNVDFAVIMDNEMDILLKSTILSGREKVMFRQRVVLKSFSSNEYSSLYNYKEDDDKYYISVVSRDYYTYVPIPVLSDDNIEFTPSAISQSQSLCEGGKPVFDTLSFHLKSSNNISASQIEKLSDMVQFRVYEIKNGEVGGLVSSSPSFAIEWNGEPLAYRCVAALCRDSIFKDIHITCFEDIKDNVIAFSVASESSKSITRVENDSPSPAINGSIVSGGYGTPTAENRSVYIYRYLIREPNGFWQPIGDDIVVSGGESYSVSLKKGSVTIDRKYEIARVVISRVGTDVSTQVSDTSNILTIDLLEEISLDDIKIVGNGECAGTKITIAVNESHIPLSEKNQTKYYWRVDDKSLSLTKSGEMDSICEIYNSTSDFNLSLYRKNNVTGIKTSTLTLPISVSSIKPYFSIESGEFAGNILDVPDEIFYFPSGTRFLIKNGSVGADSYIWNLELQYYTGTEVEGLKSYLENPVCYLYNQGQNKIRLTAKNSDGCESSVTAENIYIQPSASQKSGVSFFADEEVLSPILTESYAFDVAPTVTSGDPVTILFSGGEFEFTLMNSLGQLINEGCADYAASIEFSNLPAGYYHLFVKSINSTNAAGYNSVYKILKR